ncbi:uncharacterized protein LOC144127613 [Amblyomma americanum]
MFAVLAALLLRSGSAAASLGCASLAERNVTLYADTSFAFAWNFLASRIARSLADDVDTDKVLDDKTFDMHTGLASLAALHQPRLNRAWYLMTTAIVALLVLLPVAVMSRVQTQFRFAFVRKWLALPAHSRDSMAPYTVCTAVFAALITLFYVFQVCSSVGAENGVDVMQSKAWNIRKDMRAFLNSMNCRFDRFLDGDIKPTLEAIKGTFSSGISSSFPKQLGREVRVLMTNTSFQAVYNASFVSMLHGTVAEYANKEEVAASLNNIVDSANKTDLQIQELWKQLVGQFGILKSEGRRDAVEQVNKIQKTADKVQDNVHRKITAAKDVLITHEITYPGFVGIKTSPFQAGRRRLRLLTFVTSLLVVVFVLCLVVTFALGVSMRSPDTMPVERGKFSNFAGLAILFTAYGALPASAVLLLIGRNIMNLSVAAQAFICTPYSRRSPSLVDHIRFAAETNRRYTAHILDYLTYPSSFAKCASTLEEAIKTDIEPLETIDIGQVRKKLLGSSDSAAYRHNDTDLKALMQYVLDFKAYLDDEKLRVNIESEARIRKLIDDITLTLVAGGDALAQKMSEVIEKSYRNIVRRKVLRLEAAFSGVKRNVIAALGHCDELKQAYDSGVSILCNVVLSNTNGFWVALVVTALLVACASFTSLRLSRQCLKITRMAEPDALSDKDHRSKANVGREACGDFRSSPSPDDDLNVTVLGGSVEGDHAFRA